jgi:hypothetical protein
MKFDLELLIAILIFIGIVVFVDKLGWSLGIDIVFFFIIFGYEFWRMARKKR